MGFDAVIVPGCHADESAGAEVQQREVGGDLLAVAGQDIVAGLLLLILAELCDPLQSEEFLGSPPLAVEGDVVVVGDPVAACQLLQRLWCFERNQPAHRALPAEIVQSRTGRKQRRKSELLPLARPLRVRRATGEPLLATCCLLQATLLLVGLARGLCLLIVDDQRKA
ncbi:hypothetical protein ACWDWV_00220 [Streptosporangium sandarakinum]